ncbi:Tn3 family transposase TnXax1 [Sinobacterium norvegicum]|uniref:Tn3 family transposase TnXax1 n=1 Tax=Sinobacterium norvegicum TaxID=1641715 RepID=A0ABN8EQS2_9GAMM|nr:lytic murein transglycosylase [Sinobacterium norvegicum]CAH0993397.1 Tn3 family transposase TnXax1 [Sinobacterium norvegicum]
MHYLVTSILLLASTYSSVGVSQQSRVEQTQQSPEFSQCIQRLSDRARAEGFREPLIEQTLGQVQEIKRVIALDKKQPEFTQSFSAYLYGRVNEQRIRRGRELYQQYQPLLKQLTAEYGIPGQYLIAFWGLETNYGGYLGKMPIIDSLATLACDARRSEFFSQELMLSLQLMDEYGYDLDKMKGSWAGAMGNTQFMPSTYVKYARDGDGNGKVDLWKSIPDALTSSANFLNGLGWQEQERWGREVILPSGFNYQLAGRQQTMTVAEWGAMGMVMANGQKLPAIEHINATLLVPAGHQGPAFLLYDNFEIIMKWNRSEFYALSVGHLADRIVGGYDLTQRPSAKAVVKVSEVEGLQQRLTDLGFDTNGVDGVMGPGTRAAVSRFQAEQGLIADGFPSEAVFSRLAELDAEQ